MRLDLNAERRRAGLTEVPAIVRTFSEAARLEAMAIENNDSWGLIGRVAKRGNEVRGDGLDHVIGQLLNFAG